MTAVDLGVGALATLAAVSLLCGAAACTVFSRYSNQAALRRGMGRIVAYLLEFRLFLDEPALVLRAQWNLIVENWRLLGLLSKPSAIVTVPMLLVAALLEAFFGTAGMVPGRPALVTLESRGWDAGNTPVLEAPRGIAVETPAVRAIVAHQVVWRIRPLRELSGVLRVRWGSRVFSRAVVAGAGLHYLPGRLMGSMAGGGRDWIAVTYPPATICGWDWLAWFVLFSAMGAGLAWRKFGGHGA